MTSDGPSLDGRPAAGDLRSPTCHPAHCDTRDHAHDFGQDAKRPGEKRTILVVAITAVTMGIELAAGILFGSMALLADGLHMASHAVALTISAAAYIYARRHARDESFSFGTGKVNALGGFTGAVLLAVFAGIMAVESLERLLNPVAIAFNQAIAVALIGLVINGISVLILGGHSHDHPGHDHQDHPHHHPHEHADHHHHGHRHAHLDDHNLKAAYLHVLADALTSILAIAALLAAKYAGLLWMDPAMGLVGAVLVVRWSIGLLKSTATVLLDHQAAHPIRARIRECLEQEPGTRVADLHVWSIGPSIHAAIVSLVTTARRSPEHYKSLLPKQLGIVHVTVEVHEQA